MASAEPAGVVLSKKSTMATAIIIRKICFSLALAAICAPSIASDDAKQCAQLDNDRARLACFDTFYPKTESQTTLKRQSQTPPTQITGPTKPTVAGSSASSINLPKLVEVIEVRKQPQQKTVYLLANREVWVQSNSRNYSVRPGDKVSFKQGFMTSIFMVTSKGTSIRVKKRS